MIAIIPARGGSKGLPGKNIKKLKGKPLIAYTIEAALKAKGIDKVIVSTDDQEIAKVAVEAGADVPFMRPDYLASDTSSAVDVYIHAVETLNDIYNMKIDKFAVLLPTAPLRGHIHIEEALELFYKENADTLVSMKDAPVPISWYFSADKRARIKNLEAGNGSPTINRQKNAQYYIPNGAIYILDYNLLKDKRTYYSDNTIMYHMKDEDSVDIDTLQDFEYAEFLLDKHNGGI